MININPFPELRTNSLLLRQLKVSDAKPLFKIRSHPIVNTFLAREDPKSEREINDFINKRNKDIKNKKLLYWAICKTTNTSLIGTVCLWNFDNIRNSAEVGYELHPNFHKKGYMTEALEAVLNLAFNTFHINSVEALTHKNNSASRHLLAKFKFKKDIKRTDENNDNNVFFEKLKPI